MSLISDIEGFATITSGKQQEYYLDLLSIAKPVEVVSIQEAFTKDEINKIKRYVRPKVKMCYMNSYNLTCLFPDKVRYVEGRFSQYGIPIDHAFNRVGDKYVDITAELALKEDVSRNEYIAYAEYDQEQIFDAAYETGYYGGYYNFY